ncbi:PD-(D/E)XK nuclease-like domain-containing protein [Adonisia turfae]
MSRPTPEPAASVPKSAPLVRLGQGDLETRIHPSDLIPEGDAPTMPTATAEIDLGFLEREPAEAYHARRGELLTSHALADFRRCPRQFQRKQLGMIAERDSAVFAFGRAAHVLIVEGRERFDAEFAVGGPINPRTGRPFGSETKAFAEWAERVGKPVVSEADAALLGRMDASVREHVYARELLRCGVAEGVVRANYCGVACQARLDWVNPLDGRGIVDLKTCDDLDRFEEDAVRFGYPHQLAFYREVVVEAASVELECHLIAVEKREPFRCGVWQLSRRLIDRAADENVAAIGRLAKCRDTDVWPTGFESMRLMDPA